MRNALCALLLLIAAAPSWAADIEGRVVVLEKSGQRPLKSHAHAIVYLDGFSSDPNGVAVMDQRHKQFVPRLLPVVSGQTVRFSNSDIFQHSVFSPHAVEPFDLSRYRQGESRTVVLKEIGPHTIYCNIHQSMIADVFVVPNRYFALTDDEGRFRIARVPRGEHRLRAWHILGGETNLEVTVGDSSPFIPLTLRSRRLVVEMSESPRHNPQKDPYDDITEYDDY